MSALYRQQLVDSPKTIFQDEAAMHADLLNDQDNGGTHTQLVALLGWLVFTRGWAIEFTMIRTGHHNDVRPGTSGVGTHWFGWAADLWPLNSNTPGDYIDADDPRFQDFLEDLARAPFHMQTGLVGDGADSAANFVAARTGGAYAFQDSGGPHVHAGAKAT